MTPINQSYNQCACAATLNACGLCNNCVHGIHAHMRLHGIHAHMRQLITSIQALQPCTCCKRVMAWLLMHAIWQVCEPCGDGLREYAVVLVEQSLLCLLEPLASRLFYAPKCPKWLALCLKVLAYDAAIMGEVRRWVVKHVELVEQSLLCLLEPLPSRLFCAPKCPQKADFVLKSAPL